MFNKHLCVLTCLSVFFWTAHGSFEGFQLLSITPSSPKDVQTLHDMAHDLIGIDFWQEPASNMTTPLMVPPGLVIEVEKRMTVAGITWKKLDVDISRLVSESSASPEDLNTFQFNPRFRAANSDIVNHNAYHDYSKITEYLIQLQNVYSSNMELNVLSHPTHEGRWVNYVKLHGSPGTNKPAIILEAGIHAREWVSPAATMFVIEKLLQGYHTDDQSTEMLDKYDWYVIPVTNPDGYTFTFKHDDNRMWRKNRRNIGIKSGGETCKGVDLNRNFDFDFGNTGVSWNCYAETYPGEHGFSEPETANIRELFTQLRSRLVSYISIHAYSQLLLVPWGHVRRGRPSNSVELDRVANLMADRIYATNKEEYEVGTAYKLLRYSASGAAEDWALSQKDSIYSYCFELRPDGNDIRGFLLPPHEIIPTGEEFLASLRVMADEMRI